MTLANEGLEAQKKDAEISERKRKKEAEKHWEGQYRHQSTLRRRQSNAKLTSSSVSVSAYLREPRREGESFRHRASCHQLAQ